MATSYISAAQKSFINSAMDNIHETFAREITVIMNPIVVVISTSPSYNSFYKRDLDKTNYSDLTPQSFTFKARITYLNGDQSVFPGAQAQQKIIYPTGSVKIKVQYDAYLKLKEARKVDLDGRRYSIVSDYKPYGMFGPQYYSFLLSPIDE
jgi:hypothetical protein